MRRQKRWMPLLIGLLAVLGCLFALFGETRFPASISSAAQLLYDEEKEYYPIRHTERIKMSYPSRPFHTDVTVEGVGWRNGRFFVVLASRVRAEEAVSSYLSTRLTPKVAYLGKTVVLTDLLWEEGSDESYNGSLYRYAMTAPEADFLPVGTLPDELYVAQVRYPLPERLPEAESLPAKHLLKANVGKVKKVVGHGDLTYQVDHVRIDGAIRKVSLLVTSEVGGLERNRFLLKDDKGRRYTLSSVSLPLAYDAGENKIELEIEQLLPADINHLELIIFQMQLLQQPVYEVINVATIPVF